MSYDSVMCDYCRGATHTCWYGDYFVLRIEVSPGFAIQCNRFQRSVVRSTKAQYGSRVGRCRRQVDFRRDLLGVDL